MKGMKVLTLNTWMREGPYEQRKLLIRSWIESLNPDLIGFQEVDETQTSELLLGLGYQHTWGNGLAVATRWSFDDINHFDLPCFDNRIESGGPVLATKIETPIGLVPFVNTTTYHYLPRDGWMRELQMPVLNELLKSWRKKGEFPTMLVGDFNAVPESNEQRYLRGLCSIEGTSTYFTDAWEVNGSSENGATWSTLNPYASGFGLPDRRIDYIFFGSPGVQGPGAVISCKVVCNEGQEGIWPSDHFGVFAELSIE